MTIGSKLKEAMQDQQVEQLELALDVNYSRQSVSAWANDRRRIPDEVLPQLTKRFDDPDLYLESALVATAGASLPPLDGDYIQQDRLAMIDLMKKETREAMDKMERLHLFKPPRFATDQDKQDVKNANEEVLEAACAMVNMVGTVCEEYGLSVKETYRRLMTTLKVRRMRK